MVEGGWWSFSWFCWTTRRPRGGYEEGLCQLMDEGTTTNRMLARQLKVDSSFGGRVFVRWTN